MFQCLRTHNYVRFFRILKDAPVIVAAMIYSLYGQHMRITGLSLISKLSAKEISLEQTTRCDVKLEPVIDNPQAAHFLPILLLASCSRFNGQNFVKQSDCRFCWPMFLNPGCCTAEVLYAVIYAFGI